MFDQQRRKPFPQPESREIIRQNLLGLEYLHSSGISHRDIKPANILVMVRQPSQIHVKIADFGISSEVQKHQTKFGTSRYMAPEVHSSNYTSKVGIWSLGVMAAELWLGLPETARSG